MTNNEIKRDLQDFILDEDIEKLESDVSRFNIFEAIGGIRSELRHSNILAFLMTPSESHGLGDYFLKKFMKIIVLNNYDYSEVKIGVVDIDVYDFTEVDIYRERNNMDILLVSDRNNIVCVIENKVDASESEGQLKKYKEIIKNEYSEFEKLYVFLTPDGIEAKDGGWIQLSYKEIYEVLQVTLNNNSSRIGEDVCLLIRSYNEIINRHIMIDNEVSKLCQKIYFKHKQAIDLIIEHKPDRLSEIRDYLVEKVSKEERLILDKSVKSYIRFSLKEWEGINDLKKGSNWTDSNRILLFEFRNRNDGLALHLLIGPSSEDGNQVRKKIFDGVQNKGVFSTNSISNKYTSIYKKVFLQKKTLQEENDLDIIKGKIDSQWNSFFNTNYDQIKKNIIDIF